MRTKSESRIAAVLLITTILTCSAIIVFSQSSQKLDGLWVNEKGTRKASFYLQGNRYFGKIVWVSEEEERVKPGDVIFKDLTSTGDGYTGLAATPRQGEISCMISFENDTKLKITVSKGFMSRSVYWSRVDAR